MLERISEHSEFLRRHDQGIIEVITGSMYSGKSEELMRRCRRATIAKQSVQIFKPLLDNRRGVSTVNSYDGNSMQAISVESSQAILENLPSNVDVIAIDEAQFFDYGLLYVCDSLANRGVRVIVAGLNTNFKGEPFGVMGKLIPVADQVDTLHAICATCGGMASRTQRMIKEESSDGKWEVRPADYDDPLIIVGGAESETSGDKTIEEFYEARCRRHHVVPMKKLDK